MCVVYLFFEYASKVQVGYWVGKTAQHLMLIKLLTPMMVATYVVAIFQGKLIVLY